MRMNEYGRALTIAVGIGTLLLLTGCSKDTAVQANSGSTTTTAQASASPAPTSSTPRQPTVWWRADTLTKALNAIQAKLGPGTHDYSRVRVNEQARTVEILAFDPQTPETLVDYTYDGNSDTVGPAKTTPVTSPDVVQAQYRSDLVSAQVMAKALASAPADTAMTDSVPDELTVFRHTRNDTEPVIVVSISNKGAHGGKSALYDLSGKLLEVS